MLVSRYFLIFPFFSHSHARQHSHSIQQQNRITKNSMENHFENQIHEKKFIVSDFIFIWRSRMKQICCVLSFEIKLKSSAKDSWHIQNTFQMENGWIFICFFYASSKTSFNIFTLLPGLWVITQVFHTILPSNCGPCPMPMICLLRIFRQHEIRTETNLVHLKFL